jgi:hypothetical protein
MERRQIALNRLLYGHRSSTHLSQPSVAPESGAPVARVV